MMLSQEEFDKKINDLRAERNEFNKKAGEIQTEIDRLFMEQQNLDSLAGKCLKIKRFTETEDLYIFVEKVDRRYHGASLNGPSIKFYPDTNDVVFFEDDDIDIKERSDIEIVDPKEVLDKLTPRFKRISKIFNGGE